MAIVKMKKLSVVGMNAEKQDLLKSLMDLGVVEVSSNADKLTDEEWSKLVEKDGDEEGVATQDKELNKAVAALDVLSKYTGIKSSLFTARKMISRSDFEKLAENEAQFEAEAQELIDLNDRYNEATVEENQAVAQVQALSPWIGYELPMQLSKTDRLTISKAVFPPTVKTGEMAQELEDAGCPCFIEEVGRDKQLCYAVVAFFKEDEEQAVEILKSYGYTPSQLSFVDGTVTENIEFYEKEQVRLAAEKEEILTQIKEKASYKDDLEFYHDLISIRRDESRVRSSMLNTEKTFTFDGWLPAAAQEKVEKLLDGYTCSYEFADPEDGDEIPVIMKNNSFVKPMEFITGLYSLPSAREVDPTAIFTLFYIVFFGMMFADVGYGLILFAATLFAIKHYKLNEGGTYELMKVLNYCGVSSAVFGVLFGSYFGDLVTVIGKQFFGADITIKPLWLNPTESSMSLLVVSCALGVLHLFVGMGIKAYEQIKEGDVLGAINDNFVWYVVVLGLVLWLFGAKVAPWGPVAGKWMTLVGFGAAIVIPIFQNKGVGKALGLWNIYSGVTGNLSDILSYSRLLGLGLASASIAQVVNFLASLVGHGGAGVILFIIVELLGHTLNFAINALGSFVHSARLQYVEFFGRFFEGGGEAFKPFAKDTKYYRIIEEGK